MKKTCNKKESLKVRLVNSSDIVNGAHDSTQVSNTHYKNKVEVAVVNTMALKGSNRNKPFNAFQAEDDDFWFNHLSLGNPPFFLRKYLKNEDKPIYICQQALLEDGCVQFGHQTIQEIFSLKYVLKRFEKLYSYSDENGAQGVLFMLDDQDCGLLRPFEELFSYIEPHLDMYGERSYWYMPTDQSAHDDFVELSEIMTRELGQYLWREQKMNSALRQFLQNMNP
jgi:hypothetical protein